VELDVVQASVVALADDADAVVLGAAGTGKTTAAIEVVADRVLDRRWDPASVLVIAATRRSAARLRDRLAARLGVTTPGSLARTTASLAHAIVARSAAAEGARPPRYVSGADHDRIIAALLTEEIESDADGYWPDSIGRAVRGLGAFRSELRDLYARAVERGVRSERLAELGGQQERPAWTAAAEFMPKLAARIEREFAGFTPLDSTYVMRRAAELARAGDPSVPALRLIVVDDAQESGYGATELLRALGAGGSRIIAFGDPDLATGGFRGALPGAFGSPATWSAIGREPERIVLGVVHRHGSAVRSAVSAAVAGIGAANAGRQRAATATTTEGRALAVTVRDSGALVAYAARLLRERAVDGTEWSDLAVVVRTGGAVPRLARELRALEVPAAVAGVGEVRRDDWAVTGLLAVARIALASAGGEIRISPAEAEAVLTGSVGRLDTVSYRRLRTSLRRDALAVDPIDSRASGELVANALEVPGGFLAIEHQEGRAAQRSAKVVHAAIAAARGGASAEELLWTIWSESGLERLWGDQAAGAGLVADEANRHLDAVLAVFAAAKRFNERAPAAPAAQFFDGWAGADVEEDSLAVRSDDRAVVVGTPSALMGMEFDTLLVADLQDGVWPNPRVRGSFLGTIDFADLAEGIDPASIDRRREVLHDELRMFASAAGKARHSLVAIAIDGEELSPSPLLAFLPEQRSIGDDEDAIAPLTLRGLVGRLRRDLTRGDRSAAAGLARLAAEGVPGADPAQWYGMSSLTTQAPIVPDGHPVEVHPSQLGAFLECPLHWLLGQLGADTSSAAASLGTIVHRAADAIAADELEPTAAAIFDRILESWGEFEFESDWIDEKERARAAGIARRLAQYEADLAASGGTTLVSETRLQLELGRAILQGRIDRVELVVEDDVELAVVVDFKTGRESKNSTKAQLEANAQLATYQLALAAGAIGGVDEAGGIGDALYGGARLVILTPLRGQSEEPAKYDVRSQVPLDAARAAEWREVIANAADGMAGSTFFASIGSHCTAWGGGGLCPVHIVQAVSA